jgi:hypothetical protein
MACGVWRVACGVTACGRIAAEQARLYGSASRAHHANLGHARVEGDHEIDGIGAMQLKSEFVRKA